VLNAAEPLGGRPCTGLGRHFKFSLACQLGVRHCLVSTDCRGGPYGTKPLRAYTAVDFLQLDKEQVGLSTISPPALLNDMHQRLLGRCGGVTIVSGHNGQAVGVWA
jgi:hypothetical protein